MVSILPSDRSGLEQLGRYIGGGMQNALPQQYENMKYQRGMDAITRLQQSMKMPNQDQGDVLAELARAISANPNLERSGLAEYIGKLAKSKASHDIPLPLAREPREKAIVSPRPEAPEFLNQLQPGNKKIPGQVPQEALSRQKLPEKDPSQLAQEAPEYAKQSTQAGNPMTTPEAYDLLKKQNSDVVDYNARVDVQQQKRIAGETKYGQRGIEKLQKRYPTAPPELQNYFQRKGEEAAQEGKSEADVNTILDREAEKVANMIKNVDTYASAPRTQNTIVRALNGTYRNFDDSAKDLRSHLQPFIESGLYDFAREKVQKLGYYPEEVDIVVKPLTPSVQSAFNELPKIGSGKSGHFAPRPYADINPLKESIKKALSNDDDFSLVLGRKMAEDKGYNWQEYRDAINELGEEGMEFGRDQSSHKGDLDSPPTTFLSEFLHGLGITGR